MAQSRADQKIAHFNIGIVGDVRNVEFIGCAGAEGDGTQSVPVDLHRYGMARVGDQHRGAAEGADAYHLSHHSVGIEQGLALEDVIVASLVELHLAAERIEVDGEQLGDLHPFPTAVGRLQQFAQALVFILQRGKFEQSRLLLEDLSLERTVLFNEGAVAGETDIRPLGDAAGDIDRILKRIDENRETGTDRFQVVLAVVHEHDHHR